MILWRVVKRRMEVLLFLFYVLYCFDFLQQIYSIFYKTKIVCAKCSQM